MARYLVDRGYQSGSIFAVDTRDGMKYLSVLGDGNISVNMGKIELIDGEIEVIANGHRWSGGLNIDVGNPHAVVIVDSVSDAGDLKSAPVVSPANEYPDGVNVEFVEFLESGELKMRVHERGVGETKSCGTGTCAVALAATVKKGMKLPSKWVIHPPGGTLQVEIDAHNNAILTGPAVLLKDCELDPYL
jgi:diaminopimelate epimerase